jgi:DNA adenine methylase
MKYLGSKARHADEILSIILKDRADGQPFVEPFVGGGNVIVRVPAERGPRIANDYNFHMVQLLDQLGNHGWVPPETLTESEYNKISKWTDKKNGIDSPGPNAAMYALTATGPSFGSKWFGGFARDGEGKRDFWREGRANAMADAPGLKGVVFYHRLNGGGDYRNLTKNNLIPPGSIIYCDPPYANTTDYSGAIETISVGDSGTKNEWKAREFWKWADKLVDTGHKVFVSEYSGPRAGDVYTTLPPSDAEKAVMAELRRVQAIKETPTATIEALQIRLRTEFAAERASNAERLAARWQVVWEKSVLISAGAADKRSEGTEKLFTRL